jgi:transcriptional regulator with XRE-family HTH domain
MGDSALTHSLGAAIKARRQQLGWSQEELAQRVAARGDATFRQSDVSRLERGRIGLPHRERLEHIASVLALSVGELLARSGWAGAETAFLSGAVAEPFAGPRAAREGWRAARTSVAAVTVAVLEQEHQRAGELIAQAQATRARTQEIMQRCEATRTLVERVMGEARSYGADD